MFWVTGLGVWFVAVVLLLPVVMEGDALPGLNRWFRAWGKGLVRDRGEMIG